MCIHKKVLGIDFFYGHIHIQSRLEISLKQCRLKSAVLIDKIALVIIYRSLTIKSSYISWRLKRWLDWCMLNKYMLYQVSESNLRPYRLLTIKSFCVVDLFFPNRSDKINKWINAVQERLETFIVIVYYWS